MLHGTDVLEHLNVTHPAQRTDVVATTAKLRNYLNNVLHAKKRLSANRHPLQDLYSWLCRGSVSLDTTKSVVTSIAFRLLPFCFPLLSLGVFFASLLQIITFRGSRSVHIASVILLFQD